MLYRLVLLMIPVIVRQYQTTKAVRRGEAKKEIIGGRPSVVVWLFAYLTLLGFAIKQLATQPLTWWFWVGYVVFWAAVILRWRASRSLKGFYAEAVVIQDDHRVVREGIYRHLRHPLHLGLWLEMLGLSMMSETWYSLPILLLAFVTLLLRNRNEERLLEKYLGDAYREYRRTAWDVTDLIFRFRW